MSKYSEKFKLNENRPLPGKKHCAGMPYPGAFPEREGETEKRD